MVYELRTYWAESGKRDALHERFRSLTLRIFARHQMQLIGFWTPDPITPESGDLVYLLAFPDQAAQQQAWAAFRKDTEWLDGRAASEQDGPLTARIISTTMQPTDYSPMR